MIITGNDSLIKCTTCGEAAVQRETTVRHGAITRRVVYQTHQVDMNGKLHNAVHSRIDKFHQRAWALLDELRATPAEERYLEYGGFSEFEIITVKPSACDVRSEIVPVATVRVGSLEEEVRLPARTLKRQTAAKILAELRAAAAPVVSRLKINYELLRF